MYLCLFQTFLVRQLLLTTLVCLWQSDWPPTCCTAVYGLVAMTASLERKKTVADCLIFGHFRSVTSFSQSQCTYEVPSWKYFIYFYQLRNLKNTYLNQLLYKPFSDCMFLCIIIVDIFTSMVLEDLFFLLLHLFTHPRPVHHISTRAYSFLPVQMTGGRVST